ncbi:MAG: ABC transporter ATP-binding protein [Planctomycetes bacterium]|nr:ABC transporter ATP-binding protein [Planctomycetota bacterium]
MPTPLIETRALSKRFGTRAALDGVSFELHAGEILGLVGANGSGKTTLLRVLAGLLRPSAGHVRVLGHEPWLARERVMERVRFAFAPPALFDNLTAREHLVHLARLGGHAPLRSELDAVLETVGLAQRAEERVRAFSFGMRQRLSLALALVPRPELLVLDEPTEGLDPLAVLELRALLLRLRREQGVTILLSSHLLSEVGELVDRLVVLAEGCVRFAGTPAELVAPSVRTVLVVADAARARAQLATHGLEARAGAGNELELAADALTLEEAARLLGPGELREFHRRGAGLEQALLARLSAERDA